MTKNVFANDIVSPNITTLTNKLNDIQTDFLNLVFPVGSIYTSFNSTLPTILSNLGTWESINNKFIFAIDPTNGFTNEDNELIKQSGLSGGNNSVTLSVNNLPSHDHLIYHCNNTVYTVLNNTLDQNCYNTSWLLPHFYKNNYNTNGQSNVDINITSDYNIKSSFTGNNQSFSIIPPYITVFAWRRTA